MEENNIKNVSSDEARATDVIELKPQNIHYVTINDSTDFENILMTEGYSVVINLNKMQKSVNTKDNNIIDNSLIAVSLLDDDGTFYFDSTIYAIGKNGIFDNAIMSFTFKDGIRQIISTLNDSDILKENKMKVSDFSFIILQPSNVSLSEYLELGHILNDVLIENKLSGKSNIIQQIKPNKPEYGLIRYMEDDTDDEKPKKKDKKDKKKKKKNK